VTDVNGSLRPARGAVNQTPSAIAGAWSPNGRHIAVIMNNTSLGVVPANGVEQCVTKVAEVRTRDGLGRGPVWWPPASS
jgi:hypothetical protein